MSFDTHSTLGYSTVASITSQAAGVLTLDVQTGHGSRFAVGQQVTIWPVSVAPTLDNAMIGRITGISTDTLTISYATGDKEGTSDRTVLIGDQIANTITPKALTDIESATQNIVTSQIDTGGQIGKVQLTYNLASDVNISGIAVDTWTDVIANQNFTVDDANSIIMITANGMITLGSNGQCFARTRFVIDSGGTPQNILYGGTIVLSSAGMNGLNGGSPIFITGLSAGTHTVKLQAWIDGTGSITCRASSLSPHESLAIRVLELKR